MAGDKESHKRPPLLGLRAARTLQVRTSGLLQELLGDFRGCSWQARSPSGKKTSPCRTLDF